MLNYFATIRAIGIKLANTVGHFLHDFDFANVYMALPSCSVSHLHCDHPVLRRNHRRQEGKASEHLPLPPSCVSENDFHALKTLNLAKSIRNPDLNSTLNLLISTRDPNCNPTLNLPKAIRG